MLVIIDNYDSFTYNIVQTIASNALELSQKADVQVFRNDKVSVQELVAMAPERILISPGPCTPSQAGISIECIKYFSGKIHVLGVCLGHQSIAEAFGGRVVRASRIMHGKTSPIYHDNKGVFAGVTNPFNGMRYHSLIVEKESIPHCFEISAWTEEGEIMGLRHKSLDVEGVQFHPESIMTPDGVHLLKNFMTVK
jgi:anthranilate synthase/aminodeoxychorismate synthase-like glutamine amidotransferase